MNKKSKKCAFKCTTNVNKISNYISLLKKSYDSTKSFQFLNSCEENDRAFVLLSQKMQNNYHQLQQMYIVNHLLINIKMNRKICFFASCKICG
jgi:hypothetical protein